MTGTPATRTEDESRTPSRRKRSEEIEQDIRRTRAEMSETLDEIEQRLSPSRLKQEAKDTVRETLDEVRERLHPQRIAERAGRAMFDAVKDHPMPALIAGLSLGYLVMKAGEGRDRDSDRRRSYGSPYGDPYGRPYDRRRGTYAYRRPEDRNRYYEDDYYEGDYDYGFRTFYEGDEDDFYYGEGPYESRFAAERGTPGYTPGYGETHGEPTAAGDQEGSVKERVAGTAEDVKHRAGHLAEDVKHQAEHLAEDVKHRAGHLADETRHRVRRAGRQVRRGTRRTRSGLERFLHENPLAAGTLALGVGALIGGLLPTTERENELLGPARDRVVHRAESAAEGVATRARDAASRVVDEAKDAAQEVKDTARVEVRRLGDTAKEEATATRQEAVRQAREKT